MWKIVLSLFENTLNNLTLVLQYILLNMKDFELIYGVLIGPFAIE